MLSTAITKGDPTNALALLAELRKAITGETEPARTSESVASGDAPALRVVEGGGK